VTELLDPLASEFIAWCHRENIPENTIRRRASVLRSLGCPGTASREEVEAWWAATAGLAASSRANALSCLRTFYEWCQIWEKRADDPTVRIRPPKTPKGVPRPVTRRQLEQLLASLEKRGRLDLLRAVYLGAYAGLRVSEAARLQWTDVDLDRRRARVTGKGNKTRTVALSAALVDRLLPDTGGNVVTGQADGLDPDVLRQRANRALRRAGIPCTFHQLRHYYGTTGYRATRDLIALGKQMGHASTSTTAGYADAEDEVADAIAEAVVR
jgi:integrase